MWIFALGVAAAGSASAVARADGARDDEVDLVDGSTLHGKITEQAPGSFVVIQTSDGRVESVPWSQVRRVSASASRAPTSPTAAPPPVVAPPAPAPPAPLPQEAAPGAQTTPHEVRFEGGARLGYAVASGDYASGNQITSASTDALLPGISGGAMFTLDIGLRMARYVYVGGFFSYSPQSTSCLQAAAGSNVSCEAHDILAGIDAQVHMLPRGTVDPWVGLGVGHEWLTVSVTGSNSSGSEQASQTFEGWNYAHLLAGVDFHAGKGVGLGPYLEVTSGSFGSQSVSATASSGGSSNTASQSGDIGSTSSHQWVSVGVRGTYEAL
jgi:hypothetical protein